VGFDLAIDADSIFESAIGFGNDGRKTPGVIDLDFLLDEVDAIPVVGALRRVPRGLRAGIQIVLLLRPIAYQKLGQSGHQGGMLLIPKVAS
jgi:hypothetical protein